MSVGEEVERIVLGGDGSFSYCITTVLPEFKGFGLGVGAPIEKAPPLDWLLPWS